MSMILLPGIFLAVVMLCGSIPLGYSEPLKEQLYQNDVSLSGLSCDNENHVLVLRPNGVPVCITEKNAIKTGWKILHDNSVYVNHDGTLNCYIWKVTDEKDRNTLFTSVETQCELLFDDIDNIKCTDAYYTKYELVEPSSVTVSNGEFLHLCVERDFKWFEIHVDSKAGSTTITIPKEIVDLKQFDYPVCNRMSDFFAENSNGDKVPMTVKQVENNIESRTLQFTYSDDVVVIYNFGVSGGIFYKGGMLSEPNHCIDLVESGELDTNPIVKKEKTEAEVFDSMCKYHKSMSYDYMAKWFNIPNDSIEYSITGGDLLGVGYDEEVDNYVIFINAVEEGLFVITLPNQSFDGSLYGDVSLDPDSHILLVNGVEIEFGKIITTKDDNTYSIPFPSCGQEIEIIRNYNFP